MATDYDDIPPSTFGRADFAMENQPHFDKFVEYRLHGISQVIAFRKSFPRYFCDDMRKIVVYADEVEFNPYTVRRLRERIADTPANVLWNPKIAIHEFVALARDPDAQANARLGAMKELNVLCNITFVDDKGKTRAGTSLDDFYRDMQDDAEVKGKAAVEAQTVPESSIEETTHEAT